MITELHEVGGIVLMTVDIGDLIKVIDGMKDERKKYVWKNLGVACDISEITYNICMAALVCSELRTFTRMVMTSNQLQQLS